MNLYNNNMYRLVNRQSHLEVT